MLFSMHSSPYAAQSGKINARRRSTMTSSKAHFHVVGDALVDVLATDLDDMPCWEGEANASSISMQAGGSAFNTAIHLASLVEATTSGDEVAMHGCVGADGMASLLRARLRAAGVRDCLSEEPSGLSTGSCIVLSGSGRRAFITSAGAASALTMAQIQALYSCLEEAAAEDKFHVHFGGFYSYSSELRSGIPALVRELREKAEVQRVVFSTSVDVNGSLPQHVEGLLDALAEIDIYKGNAEEGLAALLGSSNGNNVPMGVKGSPAHLAETLAAVRPGGNLSVVITCGSEGAVYHTNESKGQVSAAPLQAVVDGTGAGDACAAGLLASLKGRHAVSLQEALLRGCAAGSVNCTRKGGSMEPVTPEEVDSMLASMPGSRK